MADTMNKKVILITGASSGIGKVTVEKLLAEGHIVYSAARRVEQMEDLKESGAHVLKMDVTNENDLKEGVEQVLQEQGRIDVLFNNAGYGLYGAVEDIPLQDVQRQFEVNLFGLVRLTQLVLPSMRARKKGTIINTSSVGGIIYTPLGAWYHATKHALEGWSDCLRLELSAFNIDIVVIQPGLIETAFADVLSAPMLKYSADGPYGQLAKRVAEALRKSYESGGGSPASVIADVVSKAVGAQKPKTRYAAGKYAKLMIFIRKYFGDRVFDKVVMSQMS